MRTSGVLLPISSIPSNYGMGCFSKEAYEIVDQLKEGGQSYWQILPLGPTGYGDSPYQSFSTFGGNPYLIDLEALIRKGLLTKAECEACDWGGSESYVDYEKQYLSRFSLLKKAFSRSQPEKDKAFLAFVQEESFWLEDYCLYMAIKDSLGGISWELWPRELRNREPEALREAAERLSQEVSFYRFQQYWFYTQWRALKAYANEKGIQIIGDLPIYVAFDSADAWADPRLFQFDEDNRPRAVAGCPPDAFSATGQLWGNPLYDWEYHRRTGYDWWIRRMSHCMRLYDMVRVDHFRGFDEYYAIPYGNPTAEHGTWEKGPGLELFQVLGKNVQPLRVIAEDLGFLTEGVLSMLRESGFPGMKVLQFAFDESENSDYLPHKYQRNCVVYTGTHDNETTKGWYQGLSGHDGAFAREYTGCEGLELDACVWGMIRAAMSSVADLAVIPIQDYLCLGGEARMNTPSTLGDNWKWRLKKGQISKEVLEKMRRMTKLYGRIQEQNRP
ncbi:MAG: 4-alpha-glucanotransferase [Eubacteriales bacterium]|nr:4-alpha-glucanotransferase [Eubacteriales bacterium]